MRENRREGRVPKGSALRCSLDVFFGKLAFHGILPFPKAGEAVRGVLGACNDGQESLGGPLALPSLRGQRGSRGSQLISRRGGRGGL